MTYRFHQQAFDEYHEAANRYCNVRLDLADAFVDEVERGVDNILTFPYAYPAVEEGVRRYVLRRFPYGIFYMVEADGTILIVGVGHLKRQPGYWRDRLP